MNIKAAANLATAQPRRLQQKRMAFFGASILPLQDSNGNLFYPQDDSETKKPDGNGNMINLDVIDMSADVKRIWMF